MDRSGGASRDPAPEFPKAPALVALIVYPLVGWAIVGLIKIKTARRNPWNDAAR